MALFMKHRLIQQVCNRVSIFRHTARRSDRWSSHPSMLGNVRTVQWFQYGRNKAASGRTWAMTQLCLPLARLVDAVRRSSLARRDRFRAPSATCFMVHLE